MGDSPQPSTTITHNGFFDSAALTNAIRDWYLKNDYFVQVPSHKQEIKETGRKYDQDWKGEKKITEYVKYKVDVTVHVHNINDVEVIKDGQKIRTSEAQVFVKVDPILELDWQKKFSGTKFLSWLDKIFREKILKYKIGDYWEDMVLAEGGSMASAIRNALGVEIR